MSPKERKLRRGSLEASTSERLAEIVAAAEKAAAKVIDEAEAEGRRHLSDAHAEADRIVAERLSSLAELTDSLIAQAEAIRTQSEHLLESLALARSEVAAESSPPPRGPHLSAVAPVDEPAADEPPAPSPIDERQNNAGARLLATQMAVSGSSREEIALRLRSGFEIEDSGAILDAILGPEES